MSPASPGSASAWILRKGRKAADIIYYAGVRALAGVSGAKARHRAADRQVLDVELLPKLAANDRFARVLFVGCDWYTEHVESLFVSKGRTYTTIEIDPSRARHGASNHIVAALADLGRHFSPGSLDLIICNGVIGWGLNEPAEISRSLDACVRALAPRGVLLLGWDDVPERLPVRIEDLEPLTRLRPVALPGLGGAVIPTHTYAKHTFGFFEKPDSVEG